MADSSLEEAEDSEERVFAAERIEKRRIRKVRCKKVNGVKCSD